MEKIKIVCLGGSLDAGSSSLKLVKCAEKKLMKLGAATSLIDIKELKLQIFSYSAMKKGPSPKFAKILAKIHEADGYIFVSPEYHGTVSAAFKNVIDHLEYLSAFKPPYLSSKPVGCIAVAGAESAGHSTLTTMISIVNNLRAIAASTSFAIGSGSNLFTPSGKLKDKNAERRLNRLAEEVYTLAVKLKY